MRQPGNRIRFVRACDAKLCVGARRREFRRWGFTLRLVRPVIVRCVCAVFPPAELSPPPPQSSLSPTGWSYRYIFMCISTHIYMYLYII